MATMKRQPFVWGRGGRRMTPDDIALQRQLGAHELAEASSVAPVGHWTQGLARALGGVTGNIRMGRADRAASQAAEERASAQQLILQALMEEGGAMPDGGDPVAAALLDPDLRDVGMAVMKMRQPQEAAPTEFEKLLAARGIAPGSEQWNTALDRYISGKSDPNVTVTLPGGGIFIGPQSELANVLQGGGGQASGAAPGGMPPATLPPDFFDNDGGPASAPGSFPR